MKKLAILSLSALIFAACGEAAQTNVAVNRANTNAPVTTQNQSNSLVVSSHSTDKTAPANSSTSVDQSSQTAPNQQAIDVSEMTAKIEKADKEYKAKPTDEKAKKSLAAAYFERAFALTKAAQYRSALGDFRKGLKLDPDDKEAKDMHDQIISIFESIGRQPPKEGEEPPPMPFKKQ